MAQPHETHAMAQDSVCKLVQNGDLAKTLNAVRTVPGARNPFVTSQQDGSPNGTNNARTSTNTSTVAQAKRK